MFGAASLGLGTAAATATTAEADSISLGVYANDLTDGQLGAANPYGSTCVIQTSDEAGVSPTYDAGFDRLIEDTLENIPGIATSQAFAIYNPVGESPNIDNTDFNNVPNFQDGDTYTVHFSILDNIGDGAFVNMKVDLAGLNIDSGKEVSYELAMDTDGDHTYDSFVQGNLSEVSEGENIWEGNVYVPAGVDIRNTNTLTGYSNDFGRLNLTTNNVPEPSVLSSFLIGGGVGALLLAKKVKDVFNKK